MRIPLSPWLARRRGRHWYPAAVLVVLAAAFAAWAALELTRPPGASTARAVAADCGLVRCGASLPAAPAAATSPAGNRAARHHGLPRAQPAPPSAVPPPPAPTTPAPARSPTAPARPSPAPAAQVAVTYTLDWGGGQWTQRFAGHLTLVNNGATPVSGWEVRLSFPGDQVDWVGYPGGYWGQQFTDWQFGGGALTLAARSGGETLAPGATAVVPIFAHGPRTGPASCSFNGASCQ